MHLIAFNDTLTIGRTALEEGSARRRDLYLHNKHSQETDRNVSGGTRNRNPSNREVAVLRLSAASGICDYVFVHHQLIGVVTERESVYCAARLEPLNKIHTDFKF